MLCRASFQGFERVLQRFSVGLGVYSLGRGDQGSGTTGCRGSLIVLFTEGRSLT